MPKTNSHGIPKRDVLCGPMNIPKNGSTRLGRKTRRPALIRLNPKNGGSENDMIIFSFKPDVIMIKEIGDPMTVGRHLQLTAKTFRPGLLWPRAGKIPIMTSTFTPAIHFFCRAIPP
ncbi:MAG: hypothetical protein R2875_04665 [Desulfobacterales bacterium]